MSNIVLKAKISQLLLSKQCFSERMVFNLFLQKSVCRPQL